MQMQYDCMAWYVLLVIVNPRASVHMVTEGAMYLHDEAEGGQDRTPLCLEYSHEQESIYSSVTLSQKTPREELRRADPCMTFFRIFFI